MGNAHNCQDNIIGEISIVYQMRMKDYGIYTAQGCVYPMTSSLNYNTALYHDVIHLFQQMESSVLIFVHIHGLDISPIQSSY